MFTPPAPRSKAAAAAARLGMILFIVYVVFYATYVFLAAFCPGIMAKPALGGVNIAVLYGFGLIALAFLLAVIYMLMCKGEGETPAGTEGSEI